VNIHYKSIEAVLDQKEVWEKEYRRKGKIWGRVPCEDTADNGLGIFVDLGCGDGKNLRRSSLAKNFRVGIDFSMESLLLSRKDPVLDGCHFICADVKYLPFRTSSVNNTDAHHLLGHLSSSEFKEAVREIQRIMKPGGRLMITVFSRSDFRSGKGREIEPWTYIKGNGIITHFFTRSELTVISPILSTDSIKESAWVMKIRGLAHQRVVLVVSYQKLP
jgi:ubiquinone/menaquinone biosynthesis C-methylase UbiE